MEGPRQPNSAEFENVVDFITHSLRPDAKWRVNAEYPTALNLNNLHNMRIITDENRVLSHAVLKPLIVKTPVAVWKVGAIGSVVTDEAFRNKGLSSKVMEDCIQEAKRQGCDLAILWTNLYDFYRKLGFELGGTEVSIVLNEEFSIPVEPLSYVKGAQVSADAIYRLYNQHTVSTARTSEDIKKFLQIPASHVYTAWDQAGQLVAYAVEGKGADLTNYVHEWGGNASKILALLAHIRKEKNAPITVIMPAHSRNLILQLSKLPQAVLHEGFLGMIKILNSESVFLKVKKHARSLGVADMVFETRNGVTLFGVGGDLIEITDEKDIVNLIFGPIPDIPHLNPHSIEKIKKVLPLPLWVWGWDSV